MILSFASWQANSSEPKLFPGNDLNPNLIGTYRGVVPCADCEGIQTELTLNKNKTFDLIIRYLGKKDGTRAFTNKFTLNKEGNAVILGGLKEEAIPFEYQISENAMIQLSMDGKRIEGENASKYILVKGRPSVEEKYWKLIVLHGSEVSPEPGNRKEPYLMLKAEGNRFTGNGGCNSFSGTYTLSGDNAISFTEAMSTKMECPSMETEGQILRIFSVVDSYVIKGDTLSMSKGTNPPSVKFIAVYKK